MTIVVLGAAASATAKPRPSNLPQSVGTAHVLVHYSDASLGDAEAEALAESVERAWALEVGQWRFDPPASDGSAGRDGRVDVYVVRTGGGARTDEDGFIEVDPRSARPAVVARELFHLIQQGYGIFGPSVVYSATAELAAAQVGPAADVSAPTFLAHPGVSLDCQGVSCTGDPEGNGQWPFFEYVREHEGIAVLRRIFGRLAADESEPVLDAIAASLSTGGSSLTGVYNGYVRANLLPATYSNPVLRGLGTRMPPSAAIVLKPVHGAAGLATAQLPHLAAQYFLVRTAVCGATKARPRRLSISIALPAGVGAVPSLRVDGRVVFLPVRAGVARTTVRFGACTQALLGLPNPSRRDRVDYRVSLAVR